MSTSTQPVPAVLPAHRAPLRPGTASSAAAAGGQLLATSATLVGGAAALASWTSPWVLAPAPWQHLLGAALSGATAAGLAAAAAGAVLAVLRRGSRPVRRPRRRVGAWAASASLVVAVCGSVVASGPALSTAAGAGTAGVVFRSSSLPGTAVVPLRVYADLDSGATPAQRVAAGVAHLQRAGGLQRRVVLLAVPTGSGWVDSDAVSEAEQLTGGDVAVLAVQYANLPSWAQYLLGPGSAEETARQMLLQVRAAVDALPVDRRPLVIAFGESLGAVAVRDAAEDPATAAALDGCLVAGQPGAADAQDARRPAAPAGGCVRVRNADDPVADWTPQLAVRPTGGEATWAPVVTFWNTSVALLGAVGAPVGHGHHYGRALSASWQQLLWDTGR